MGGQSPIGLPGAPSTSVVELGKQLLLASRDGNADEIRTLVGKGAPFTTDWLGTSPLHLAAQYGHVEACQRLLECGISKDARTKVDKTPLHVAAFYGHSDVMETLLKKGCDVNAVDMVSLWVGKISRTPIVLRQSVPSVSALHDAPPLGGGAVRPFGSGDPSALRGRGQLGEQVRQDPNGNCVGQGTARHI